MQIPYIVHGGARSMIQIYYHMDMVRHNNIIPDLNICKMR